MCLFSPRVRETERNREMDGKRESRERHTNNERKGDSVRMKY